MANEVDAPTAEALALLSEVLAQAQARGFPVAVATCIENGKRTLAVAWTCEPAELVPAWIADARRNGAPLDCEQGEAVYVVTPNHKLGTVVDAVSDLVRKMTAAIAAGVR